MEMSNIAIADRQLLDQHFILHPVLEDLKVISADGTVKVRFRIYQGQPVEAVLIPSDGRYTVCLSTQSGCSLSCKFCATGQLGLSRQLTAAEICDQLRHMEGICWEIYGQRPTNIVYMGMGEPLLNYQATVRSIKILTDPDLFHYSPSRITVSTAGIAKMIVKLADDTPKINLALSLHAADDEKRDKIMAINHSNSLERLMEALRYFHHNAEGKMSYEYIAFRNFNLDRSDAKNLVRLCSHFPVRINMIEYNPVNGVPYTRAEEEELESFMAYLKKKGVTVTLRRSRGRDIQAACGQLANQS